jgi:hypothetical protein
VPAQTAEQVETFVQKTVEYERAQAGQPGLRRVLAIADGQEESFAVYARLFLEDFPDRFETELLVPLAGKVATQVTQELSAGPLIAAYFGHGSLTMWGKDRLFTVEDVPELESAVHLPVVLNLTCLTGLFTHPKTGSLAEALLFEPEKGAVAVLAPSSLTLAGDQSFLTQPLVKAVADHPEFTLGELHLAARRQVDPEQPGQWEVMETFMLFGDPALRLPLR